MPMAGPRKTSRLEHDDQQKRRSNGDNKKENKDRAKTATAQAYERWPALIINGRAPSPAAVTTCQETSTNQIVIIHELSNGTLNLLRTNSESNLEMTSKKKLPNSPEIEASLCSKIYDLFYAQN